MQPASPLSEVSRRHPNALAEAVKRRILQQSGAPEAIACSVAPFVSIQARQVLGALGFRFPCLGLGVEVLGPA